MKDRELARLIGIAIKARRLELGISQVELSIRSGFKRAYVASIERGEKAITVENIHLLARALELGLAEFFSRVEHASDSQVTFEG